MLYVRKDLASKYTDWRGVERGAKRRPSKCLELQKTTRFVRDFRQRTPVWLTPAQRINLGCQRALKIILVQHRDSSWLTGTRVAAPIRATVSHWSGGTVYDSRRRCL